MKNLLLIVLSILLIQCVSNPKNSSKPNLNSKYKVDTVTWIDKNRNRAIPIAIYQPKEIKQSNHIPIIFSHGYGENQGGDYLKYAYLTEFLASKGYFVVSIQHELPTDELLAMTGKLQETRKPNWERGAENIYFALNQMKKKYPSLDYNKLSLIGHSNGGDMSVLFAHLYPELVEKIISMDNRRMKLPRTAKPKVFTLRSNDYPADDGVLPTSEEIKKFDITVQFTNINHSNMDSDATEEERKYINSKILDYLNN